jgi:Ca2+-transporting ATPase
VSALSTNEAPLTGESTLVETRTAPTGPDTPLAERRDFVFMGTSIATGAGTDNRGHSDHH